MKKRRNMARVISVTAFALAAICLVVAVVAFFLSKQAMPWAVTCVVMFFVAVLLAFVGFFTKKIADRWDAGQRNTPGEVTLDAVETALGFFQFLG